MQISVIIAYYKNTRFLRLVLDGFKKQSVSNFEIIIAEDDNAQETKDIIASYSTELTLKHVFQEDKGFRKCAALNKAIKYSSADYLVFIDGDCIPHPKFVESYTQLKNIDSCFARRVMLSEKHTNRLLKKKASINLYSLLANGSSQIKHSFYLPKRKPSDPKNKGVWGCNWGIQKKHLLAVNGFDEDYVLAGIGEDVDIEWRLRTAGIQIKYVKHLPIVYHLHHKEHYDSKIVDRNKKKLAEKVKIGLARCKNGLEKL